MIIGSTVTRVGLGGGWCRCNVRVQWTGAEIQLVVVARLGATAPLPQYGIVRLSLEQHTRATSSTWQYSKLQDIGGIILSVLQQDMVIGQPLYKVQTLSLTS